MFFRQQAAFIIWKERGNKKPYLKLFLDGEESGFGLECFRVGRVCGHPALDGRSALGLSLGLVAEVRHVELSHRTVGRRQLQRERGKTGGSRRSCKKI